MKKVKKLTAFCLMMVMSVGAFSPVISNGAGDVATSLKRDSGGGQAPVIKAKWEMNGPYLELKGTDDDTEAGAQFDAPGVWNATIQYSICAIVTDPDGVADIDGVYTDIYYPSDRAFHPMDPDHPDEINGGTTSKPDYGSSGCGAQRGDENKLHKLSKDDGYDLFCNTIRNNNNNLPTFYEVDSTTYDYNEICDPDGELMKETAYVYCADKELIWEDPAGDYKVSVFALDKAGVFSNDAVNTFEYLPLTSYEVDFSSVSYGNVKLNTHKRISGDKTFSPSDGKPTVRNLGNTRLYMGVQQDDMGLGTTDGEYNVKYDARLGNNEEDWKDYRPNANTKWLQDILDLSETEEMDFSIVVTKFPHSAIDWTGYMTLSAKYAKFRQCWQK